MQLGKLTALGKLSLFRSRAPPLRGRIWRLKRLREDTLIRKPPAGPLSEMPASSRASLSSLGDFLGYAKVGGRGLRGAAEFGAPAAKARNPGSTRPRPLSGFRGREPETENFKAKKLPPPPKKKSLRHRSPKSGRGRIVPAQCSPECLWPKPRSKTCSNFVHLLPWTAPADTSA